MKMPAHIKVWTTLLRHSKEVLLATVKKLITLNFLLVQIVIFQKEVKSKAKHSKCKKGSGQKLRKRPCCKRFNWNQNRRPMPPAFDRIKIFDHYDLTAEHCYFRCSKSPDGDGIKILDKDYQATKHCSFILMFCSLVIFIKSFDPINISGDPEHLSWWSKFLILLKAGQSVKVTFSQFKAWHTDNHIYVHLAICMT